MPELAPPSSRPSRAAKLRLAFAGTRYLVTARDCHYRLRIGAPTPPAIARRCRGRSWAIVTADNPGAEIAANARNRNAGKRLACCLERLRPMLLLATVHRDPRGVWPDEHGWLFSPATPELATRIGRRFGQIAIVTGRPGQCVEVTECSGHSRHNEEVACSPARWRSES